MDVEIVCNVSSEYLSSSGRQPEAKSNVIGYSRLIFLIFLTLSGDKGDNR